MRKRKVDAVVAGSSAAPLPGQTAIPGSGVEEQTHPGSPGAPNCAVCGSQLVITNGDQLWCPKGHDQKGATVAPPAAPHLIPDAERQRLIADFQARTPVAPLAPPPPTDPRGSVTTPPEEYRTTEPSPRTASPSTVVNNVVGSSGEYVDVTVGEELYGPVQFHAYRVGPFEMRVYLRPDEDHGQAAERGLAMLEPVLNRERARKRAVFLEFLKNNPGAR